MTRFIALVWLLTIACPTGTALALTAQEIILLKQHGVSEETIQMMLASENEARRAAAAGEPAGIRTIARPGGKKAIVYTTGTGHHAAHQEKERIKEAHAWEMLRQLIVDTRSGPSGEGGVTTD
jgi:hypothetical protein